MVALCLLISFCQGKSIISHHCFEVKTQVCSLPQRVPGKRMIRLYQ